MPVIEFRTFLEQLSVWEGRPTSNLIAEWNMSETKRIAGALRLAVVKSNLGDWVLSLPASVSNQALGNRMVHHLAEKLRHHIPGFDLQPCATQGYPDRRLTTAAGDRSFALELKASGDLDPNDTNRVVLTCSTTKLRRAFKRPVYHLLMTVCYRRRGGKIAIRAIRLDFLQPSTRVRVRFEASTSKHLLSRGQNPFAVIPVPHDRNRLAA